MEQYSEAALAKQAALEAKEARGEKTTWSDMLGIIEPNPNLPDCQSWDGHSDVQCSLPNHHEGSHRATVEW